jgi:hypothetical protein
MNARQKSVLPFTEPRSTPPPTREVTVNVSLSAPSGERMTRRRSAAWDPYEVWKTRVKTPQNSNQ